MKYIKYISIIIIFVFLFNLNVMAECSYQERKDLLNATKNVDIFYEIKTKKQQLYVDGDGSATKLQDVDYISINLTNIKDTFFVKVTNELNDNVIYVTKDKLNNNIYTIDQDLTGNIFNYYFEFFSNNNNCLGYSIARKTLKMPIYNVISRYGVCQNDKVSSSKYCKKYIEKKFNKTETEIVNDLKNIINGEKIIEDDKIVDNKNNYLIYLGIGIVVIVALIIFVVLLNKKRGRL